MGDPAYPIWGGSYTQFRPMKPGWFWDNACNLDDLQALRQMNHPTDQTTEEFQAELENLVPSDSGNGAGSDIFLSSAYPYSEYISYANLAQRVIAKNGPSRDSSPPRLAARLLRAAHFSPVPSASHSPPPPVPPGRSGFPYDRIQPDDLASNTFWDWACNGVGGTTPTADRQAICDAATQERKRIEMRRSLSVTWAQGISSFAVWSETTSRNSHHTAARTPCPQSALADAVRCASLCSHLCSHLRFETTAFKGRLEGADDWQNQEYSLIDHGVPPNTAVDENFVGYWPSSLPGAGESMGAYGRQV